LRGAADDLARKDEAVDEMVARAGVLVQHLDVMVAGMERRLNQGRQGT